MKSKKTFKGYVRQTDMGEFFTWKSRLQTVLLEVALPIWKDKGTDEDWLPEDLPLVEVTITVEYGDGTT